MEGYPNTGIKGMSLQLEIVNSYDLLIQRKGVIQTTALKLTVYDSSDHLNQRDRERMREREIER